MAWYPGAIRKEVTRFTTPMLRYRGHCLHIAVSEAASLFNYFNTPGNPCSHFYVRYSGAVEQYVNTLYRAPAQVEGNPTMIGTETQGGTTNLNTIGWTDAQRETIAHLNAWLYETHGIPLVAMRDSLPTSTGIGYHRLGIDPWRLPDGEHWSNSYAKECPGDLRIAEVPGTITRAIQIVTGGDMPTAQEIVTALMEADVKLPNGSTKKVRECWGEGSYANDAHTSILNVAALFNSAGSVHTQLDRIETLAATPFDIDQLAAAIVAKLPAGALTKADVQDACDAAIRARFADVDGA